MPHTPMKPARPTVVTAVALHQAQIGLASTDPRICDAAESVLSALTLHLRNRQATLPLELHPHMRRLRDFCADNQNGSG